MQKSAIMERYGAFTPNELDARWWENLACICLHVAFLNFGRARQLWQENRQITYLQSVV